MAEFDEKQLRAHIKSKEFFRVYLITGDESYLKRFYTNSIAEKNTDSAFESFNFERFDGKGLDLRDVYQQAMLMPMMAEKRCIVVDDFKFDSMNEKDIAAMDSTFENLPSSTVLIFKQDSAPLAKKNSKAITSIFNKHGAVCVLNKRRGADLIRPLVSSASKFGCELDNGTAQYLVNSVGDDFNVLINELNKVCNFVGSGKITRAAIDEVCIKSLDAKVYYLTKALVANDFDRAYDVLDSLLRMKTEPEYILGAIIGTYVDMYRVKVCGICGAPASSLKESFNYKGREFTITNAERDSKKLDLTVIRKCLDVLSEADLKLKSGRDNSRLVIEQTMVKLLLTANGERV